METDLLAFVAVFQYHRFGLSLDVGAGLSRMTTVFLSRDVRQQAYPLTVRKKVDSVLPCEFPISSRPLDFQRRCGVGGRDLVVFAAAKGRADA